MTLSPIQVAAVRAGREVIRRGDESPLATRRWLPGQHAFLSSRARRKVFRAGSQSAGKTEAGAAETVFRLLGKHPLRPDIRMGPVKLWAIFGGGEQGQIVQERVWDLVPKSEVVDGCYYDPRKGAFVGKYPKLRLKNGSVLEFKSGKADMANLKSGTVDGIWIDEPPENQRVLSEAIKRTLKKVGDIWITLTPVDRPVQYLRDMCESGQMEDLHYPLTVANMTPVGSDRPITLVDGTVCDQAWIDEINAETPSMERPVTVDGEWEMRTADGYFSDVWDPESMVTSAMPKGVVWLTVGIDHGHKPGKQCAYLIAIDDSGDYPEVWVVDEYVDVDGIALPEFDARGILSMLRRNHQEWSDLDEACGDRVHMPGSDEQKSNDDLEAAIAAELGVNTRALDPEIRTIKSGKGRGAGSVMVRQRWLWQVMRRRHFHVHPRCERLIDSIPKYSGLDDGTKDPIDGLVYGCDTFTFREHAPATGRPIVVR